LQTRCSFSFNIRTAVTGGDANESAGRFCNSLCRHRYTSVGKTSWSNPRSPALSGNKYMAVCAIFGSPRVRSNRPFKAGRPGPVVYPSRAMTTPRPVSWAGAGLRCQGAEAVGSLEAAMRLSPHDPYFGVIGSFRAFAHFMAGDYAAGLDWGRVPCVRILKSQALGAVWRSRPRCWTIWRRRKKPWRKRDSSSPTTQSHG